MRIAVFIAILMLFSGAGIAQAFPPIIFYTYTPPQPVFEQVGIIPENHQQLSPSPSAVTVTFSQGLVRGTSDLKIFDAYNNAVAVTKQASRDSELSVALPGNMLAGVYRVEWKATCACHGNPMVNGMSYFTVY